MRANLVINSAIVLQHENCSWSFTAELIYCKLWYWIRAKCSTLFL